MAKREEAEHVVIFPFMAQGHILPFLSLALHIEERFGFTVTFVNTPLNIKTLRPSLPPHSTINLVSLPFSSSDHGLPPDSENTHLLPYPLMSRLFHASLSLKPSFHNLLSHLIHLHGYPPICIISDMFFGWTVDVAADLGIPHAIFNAGGAYGMAVYFSLWLNLPHLQSDSNEFSLPDFPEVSNIHLTQLSQFLMGADGTDDWSIFLQEQLSLSLKSDALLFNSVEALDQTGSNYFRRKFGGRVRTIGPIRTKLRQEKGGNQDFCLEWLNTHEPSSVIYVSFGSQNTISASQMMQLAMGLENSGKNFIWVVRPPIGFDMNLEFKAKDWLPEGFEDRMKETNRGLLVRKWAPQMEILSHRSTCAFLSHCGWNSVMESLSHGVPIIGWPLAAEQFYNSKLLEEEVGVCVEVARGTRCEISHEHVREVIELVMFDGENKRGKEMRRRACEAKEILKDAIRDEEGYKGSSVRAMDEFFDMVLSMKTKTKFVGNGEV
ncbi:hypothetical protein NE237_022686 [Protea cynaroides]|uniref:Glycosyltransferase n=1 Tax=Protea cynaroides TaxID=273540 RepID=A0A9Q0K4Q0_9MAGN|nr:hypothetical protein NE237_022686 [Protea cynaroides]